MYCNLITNKDGYMPIKLLCAMAINLTTANELFKCINDNNWTVRQRDMVHVNALLVKEDIYLKGE